MIDLAFGGASYCMAARELTRLSLCRRLLSCTIMIGFMNLGE
jgi:hypothetical protein